MSGLSGQPQQDPMDSEGVQPTTPEGVQPQQREFLTHISISANSIVTPQNQPERVQQNVFTATTTPAPNASPWSTDGILEDQHQAWGGEPWISNHERVHNIDLQAYERVQGHVTPTERVQLQQPAATHTATPQPQGQVTADTSTLMEVIPTSGQVTTAPLAPPSTPANTTPPMDTPRRMLRLNYQPGQAILGKDGTGGESPLNYVSLGSSSDRSTPESRSSKRSKTAAVDNMNIEAFETPTAGESPNLLTPVVRTPATNSGSPPTATSYAEMTKGKGKAKDQSSTPLLNHTWCKLKQFAETRIPPVTDVKYSAWLNLRDFYEDQGKIFAFAATNQYVEGLTYRPTQGWVEFYCTSELNLNTLMNNEWVIGTTKFSLIPARKLAGSRVFLKFTNVTPCHSEEEIRKEIIKCLDIYGKVGQMEPHYILDPTGEYPDARLRTRRWDVELFIPERTRLIMDPVPLILETETVVYWEGQYAVCQICKVTGHWTSECNSAIRAQVQKEKMSKIPPAPIATVDQPAATNPPPTQPVIEPTPSTQPQASQKQPQKKVQVETPAAKKGTQKDTPQPAPPKTPTAPPAVRTVKEKDIIQQSRRANAARGNAPTEETIIIRDEEEGWEMAQSESQKKKQRKKKKKVASDTENEAESSKPKRRQSARLATTALEISTRPRTVGNQLQYFLWLLEKGQIITSELQTFINNADPISFITTTKPAMKLKAYESFSGWVQRRKRAGEDDIKDALKWKVSVPDHMNPANPSYIDTSISAKKYREQEEARLNKSGKLTVWFFTDNLDARNAETINFRPKDKMSVIARNIKRKFKLNFLIDLRIADTENNLRMEKTADESNLKDGMTLVVSRTVTETVSTDSMETPERILVKVQRPTSNKPWTFSLEPSASTNHLYHEVAQQTHTRTHQFYLIRSNDSQVSRYTTIAGLNLRLNEVLIIKQIEPIRVDTYWLDASKDPQNKITYLDRNITLSNLGAY